MKKTLKVKDFMTEAPHTVGAKTSLKKATHLMREYKIRHLPVLDGGKLVGILSDRDVHLVESMEDVNPDEVTVSEAYTPDPYITHSDELLSKVCVQMREHKFGSALVVDNNKLVGIFTWIDALKAIEFLLNK